MKNTYSLLLTFCSQEGLISRIAMLLERRGYAIKSLYIKERESDFSSLELTIHGDIQKFEQVCKQLEKLIDVVSLEVVKEKIIDVEVFAA